MAGSDQARTRREPPPFVPLRVVSVEARSPRLARILFAGDGLGGMAAEPGASVRLLLPSPGGTGIEIPVWTGNQFLLDDGRRPVLRTLTPRRSTPTSLELEIVLHGRGAASEWAAAAAPGDPAAVSGPGRGYDADADASSFVLAGDETALPAISQLLEVLPATAEVSVRMEVATAAAEIALPHHPGASVAWHVLPAGARPGDTLVAAVEATEAPSGSRWWVAGEAAAVQRIRRHLFDERGLNRGAATVRGYWQLGRGGAAAD